MVEVTHMFLQCMSGKITTVSRLFLEHSFKIENKHQNMNVHTKCNCLIPILSTSFGQVLAVSGLKS